jgi:hypothetical protein
MTSSGTGGTPQGPGTYGQGFNYGAAAPETQYEVNRTSQLGDQRSGALFGMGNENARMANLLGGRADLMGNQYRGQGGADYAASNYDRQSSYDALGRLRNFYEQGPGPSAAQAQLQMAGDQNMANAIAMAHSGRGAGQNAAAMRNAMFSNAATQQQLGGQAAQLRAQEEAAWRQQQLGAMGLEQGTLGTMRGQDISSMGVNTQAGLGYGQLGLGYTQAGMQNQLGFAGLGSQQQMESERLRQQILGQQLQSNVAMRGQDRGYQSAQLGGGDDSSSRALWGGLGAVAGGILGTFVAPGVGTAAGAAAGGSIGSAAGSDIRAKKNIQRADFSSLSRLAGELDKKSPQATPENPTAKRDPREAAGAEGIIDPWAQPSVRPTQPGAMAPWEQSISPFASQAPWQPFGQDPRNQQQIIPIDFSQGPVGSDREAKEQVRKETLREVFGNLDAAHARATADTGPRYDLRPAQGYSYEYKNPAALGAEPGRHYGPMAQDLLKTPAGASTVTKMPNGQLGVDTGRLALVNTAALSEQQSELDRLKALLDQSDARAATDVGSRFGGRR